MVLILAWFSLFLHMILRQGLGIFDFKYAKSILLLGYSFSAHFLPQNGGKRTFIIHLEYILSLQK